MLFSRSCYVAIIIFSGRTVVAIFAITIVIIIVVVILCPLLSDKFSYLLFAICSPENIQ